MKIGIIGAGASGMMAAVTAAANGSEVLLFEKNDRVGKKILATGKGKCNLTNLAFDRENYYCEDKEKLFDMFQNFSPQHLCDFLKENGLMLREKNGYVYPYCEQAAVVLDVFRKLLQHPKITIVLESEITDAYYSEKKKQFVVKNGKVVYEVDRLIISCGGPASLKAGQGMGGFRIASSFGHTIHKVVPGLVQLRGNDSFLKGMAGVRCQAKLCLTAEGKKLAEEQGELQFTDYGISGIPVFQFSRQAAYALESKKKVTVSLDLFPDYEEEEFWQEMQIRYERMKADTLEEFLLGTVNKKINIALIKYAGFKPEERLGRLGFARVRKLLELYRNLIVHIEATNGIENAQVCAGGVVFSEISTTMESLKRQGLFLTGEVVDVDGKCGGYNLQWAFTSGYIAGTHACK